MTLMAVDLNKDGKPVKWMVENSWGPASGYQGHLIMTDEWFDEYMFRLVLETKYVPAKVMDLFKQKPIRLPAWILCLRKKINTITHLVVIVLVNERNCGNLSVIPFVFALYSRSFLLLLRQINETIIYINAWQM